MVIARPKIKFISIPIPLRIFDRRQLLSIRLQIRSNLADKVRSRYKQLLERFTVMQAPLFRVQADVLL